MDMVPRTPALPDPPDRLIAIGAVVIAGSRSLFALWGFGSLTSMIGSLHLLDIGMLVGSVMLLVGWSRTLYSPLVDLRTAAGLGLAASIGLLLFFGLGVFGGGGGIGGPLLSGLVEDAAIACVVIAAGLYRAQLDQKRSSLVVLAGIALAANVGNVVLRPSEFSMTSIIVCYAVMPALAWGLAAAALLVKPSTHEVVPTAKLIQR